MICSNLSDNEGSILRFSIVISADFPIVKGRLKIGEEVEANDHLQV